MSIMDFSLLLVVGFLSVVLIIALALCRRSKVASLVASIFSIGCAGFCGFGFIACFEPSDSLVWPWQVAYGIFGMGFLFASFLGVKQVWGRNARGRSVQ